MFETNSDPKMLVTPSSMGVLMIEKLSFLYVFGCLMHNDVALSNIENC